MSVRAYKIKKIDTVESPTFNLWQDQFIKDHLVDFEQLNSDCCGIIEIRADDAKILLKEIKKGDHNQYFKENKDEDKKDTIEIIKQIIKDADDDYVDYYCL